MGNTSLSGSGGLLRRNEAMGSGSRGSVKGTALPCYVFGTDSELAKHVAQLIANLMRERASVGQPAVLGLCTGSSPTGIYRELVRLHQEEGLDFSHVVVFGLDEYVGAGREATQSRARWLDEQLLDRVNIRAENVHLLDGSVAADDVEEHCQQYELAIERAGGIDLQLLGIGTNGHVGCNEPFSVGLSRTRMATMDPVSRKARASEFFGEENVPTQALTMGLGTILRARKIVLVALGEHKASIMQQTLEEEATDRVPASWLREHLDASCYVDAAAAGQLTGVATPWLRESVVWEESIIKRAVLWLGEETGKALLKLEDEDFRTRNLHSLLRHHGPAERVAHRVFRWMMDTIEYHPAGRERQRVICFSPHPDDDVISMGGTLIRMAEDGHEVHVAYMTSGNIAVFDHDAEQVADLVVEFNRLFGIDEGRSREIEASVKGELAKKAPGEPDSEAVLRIKALIRWSEARSGAVACGCREEDLHFLDLPFYRTGRIAKDPISDEDVASVRELIRSVAPGVVFVAGDLSDPHGTHRVCAEIIFRALSELRECGESTPDVLLYRGAWQEWAPHEIDIAVPLSPRDLRRKKAAIFRHESQKDSALFPGTDPREFWQRAEQRNRELAESYNRIGLPEYYAMEAFVRGG